MDIEIIDGWALLCLLGGLAAAAVCDLRTMRIPRVVPDALASVWVVEQLCCFGLGGGALVAERLAFVGASLASAVGIVGGLWLIGWILDRRSGGTALGVGDLKLLGIAALYLQWGRTLIVVLLACGFALALAFALPRLGWSAPDGGAVGSASSGRFFAPVIPFAPAITLATFIVVMA